MLQNSMLVCEIPVFNPLSLVISIRTAGFDPKYQSWRFYGEKFNKIFSSWQKGQVTGINRSSRDRHILHRQSSVIF